MLDLIITDIAFGGEGIARYEGVVIFVPFVALGEKVRVKIIKKMPRFWRAELIQVLKPSPNRVTPPCPYFFHCGGCQYQHITYAKQLKIKEEQVSQLLQRIGKISAFHFLPTIGSPQNYGYRNRIVVHADGRAIGFRSFDNKTLIDIKRCEISSDEVNQKLSALRSTSPPAGHYALRESALPSTGFYQTNRYLLDVFRERVKEVLPKRGKFLFEGYCGNGFFTTALAEHFQKIVAVESKAESLSQAPTISNIEWQCDSVETALAQENPDVVLLDPPREGLSSDVVTLIQQKESIQDLVYISCNPATLARDLAKLSSRFTLRQVQLIDIFPQTSHIEIIAVLQV